jgi:hypothetical protein
MRQFRQNATNERRSLNRTYTPQTPLERAPQLRYHQAMYRIWIIVASLALLTLGLFTWFERKANPPVETIVASSLQSLHEQNRLTAFAARFVTVVTSRKAQFGLSAEKTLIIPAMVRYEVDLARLTPDDLTWDAAAKTLTIRLPPLALAGPEFDLAATREYGSGAVLMALTDAERALDQANRAKARADVLTQARAPMMIRLAQNASARAIEHSFALPLRAAGIEAKVNVESDQ